MGDELFIFNNCSTQPLNPYGIIVVHNHLLATPIQANKPSQEDKNPLPPKIKLCLWVITKEDYSDNPIWAQQIRNYADYFLNV